MKLTYEEELICKAQRDCRLCPLLISRHTGLCLSMLDGRLSESREIRRKLHMKLGILDEEDRI